MLSAIAITTVIFAFVIVYLVYKVMVQGRVVQELNERQAGLLKDVAELKSHHAAQQFAATTAAAEAAEEAARKRSKRKPTRK